MTRHLRQNFFFWTIGLPVTLVLIYLTAFGSRILIDPTAVTVTPCGDVVVKRHYPWAEFFNTNRPWVQYVQTVTPLTKGYTDGYLCREDNGSGQRYNHDVGDDFNKWNVDGFASECISDPIGFIYEARWTAYLFDVIPLRPISMEVRVPTAGNNCNQQFKSESHEPR